LSRANNNYSFQFGFWADKENNQIVSFLYLVFCKALEFFSYVLGAVVIFGFVFKIILQLYFVKVIQFKMNFR
jgi:hypothetical protein